MDQHGRDKTWWPQVQRVTVEHHRTRAEARARERELIVRLRPKYNVALVPDGAAQDRAARAAFTRDRVVRGTPTRARTVWLPARLWAEIESLARREERTLNGQVTYLLRCAMEESRRQQPQPA